MSLVTVLITASLSLTERPDTLSAAVSTARRETAVQSSAPARRISAIALERNGVQDLHEALRTLPGVNIMDYGGIGGMKTVSLRGFGSQHTAVCYDGIPVSDAQNGSIDISRFRTEGLSEVSLETGASDEIFKNARTGASAGTLNLTTQRPVFGKSDTQAAAELSYGSFQTWRPQLRLNHRLGKNWSAGISGGWTRSAGDYTFALANAAESFHARRLGADLSILNGEMNIYGEEIHARLNFRRAEQGLPGQVILYTQHPSERLWNRDISSSISWTRNWKREWRTRLSAAYSRKADRYLDNSPKYPIPEDDRYCQRELALYGIVGLQPGGPLEFSLAQDLFMNILDSNIPECVFPRRITSVSALSGKYTGRRATVVGSLCVTGIHEWVRSGTPADDKLRLSPTVSASYRLTDALWIRGSYRDGFRVPNFNDLYYARVGTASLRPEKTRQANLGLGWQSIFSDKESGNRGSLTINADFYYGRVEDKIAAVPTMFIWKMRNIGKVEMAGAELAALCHISLSSGIRAHFSLGYSFQHAVDITEALAKNYRHQIPYTPRHCGSASSTVETPWFTLSHTLNAVGVRYFLAQNLNANALAPYHDHMVSISREFHLKDTGLRLSIDALNLSGHNYEIVQGYPMPGRHYRLNLKIKI